MKPNGECHACDAGVPLARHTRSTDKFIGYHDKGALPVKAGMVVTIKRGTVVKTVGRPAKLAGRTYRVKIHHVLSGVGRRNGYHGDAVGAINPSVVWAGPGGYWSEADINDVLPSDGEFDRATS